MQRSRHLPPLHLKDQIESAYRQRGGVIVTAKPPLWNTNGSRHEVVPFVYDGFQTPFGRKTDRFHLGSFPQGLRVSPNIAIEASVMRECCKNVMFLPVRLSQDEIARGLDLLKRTKITRAAIRERIVPHLPMRHHQMVIQDLHTDLFEVVDVLTAMGRAEPGNFLRLGLFAGLIMVATAQRGTRDRRSWTRENVVTTNKLKEYCKFFLHF